MLELLRRDHHVAAAEQRRVAREAVARGDTHERDLAAEAREQLKRTAVQARDDRHVDVAWAPAAALGEQHHRQSPSLRELEQAVLLCVVAPALGTGEHHVVVGQRHARTAVDLAHAAHEPVGGGARDQLLAWASALLGGEQQRPILHERVRVEQVGDVLARRAVAALVALRDSVGPRRVQADLVALAHRAQVRALAVARRCRRGRRGGSAAGTVAVAGLQGQQQLTLLNFLSDRHR